MLQLISLGASPLHLGKARKTSLEEEGGIHGIPVTGQHPKWHHHTKAARRTFTNQRLIRNSEGKAKILQEMPKMAAQASKKMHVPLCGAPAKTNHHQCKGPRLNRIVWFTLAY